jgi:hypothetical protein
VGKHRKRRRRRRSKMSDKLEVAFQELGLDVGPGKKVIDGKKWSVNEPGETESISKALNPPSIGAKAVAVAKSSKWRDWTWVLGTALAALCVISIMVFLYRRRAEIGAGTKTFLNNTWDKFSGLWKSSGPALTETSPGIAPEAMGHVPPNPPDKRLSFGSAAKGASVDDITLMLPLFAWLEKMTVGDTGVTGLDGVRASVLYGLMCAAKGSAARDVSVGGVRDVRNIILSSLPKISSCFGPLVESAGKDEEIELARRIEIVRECVQGCLEAVKEQCSRGSGGTKLARVLDQLTDGNSDFARSWSSVKGGSSSRVAEVYELREGLGQYRPPEGGEAGFGKPRKREGCEFVDENGVRCGKLCAGFCVCAAHETELRKNGDDNPIVMLSGYLALKVADLRGAKKIQDALAELEGAASWTEQDRTERVVAAMKPGGASFGIMSALRGAAGLVLGGETSPDPSTQTPSVQSEIPGPATPIAQSDSNDDGSSDAGASESRFKRWRRMQKAERESTKEERMKQVKEIQDAKLAKKIEQREKELAKKGEQEQRKSDGDERRNAKYVPGAYFLEKAMQFINDETSGEMKATYEARARKRAALLGQIDQKTDFYKALEFHLSSVPVDDASLEESAELRLRLAERLALYRAQKGNDKDDNETVRLVQNLATFRSAAERAERAVRDTVVPVPVDVLIRRHKASAEAMESVIQREDKAGKAEYDKLVLEVTIALQAHRPVGDAHAALVAFVKKRVLERAAANEEWNKKGKTNQWSETGKTKYWEGSYARKRTWDLLWPRTPAVYRTCVPRGDVEDFDPEVGLACLMAVVDEEKAQPSIVDTVVEKMSGGTAKGSSFGSDDDWDVGAFARSVADKAGLGDLVDAGTKYVGWAMDLSALFDAVTAAAKLGEAVLIQLLELLVDGALLLFQVISGKEHKFTASAVVQNMVTSDDEKQITKQLLDAEEAYNKEIKGNAETWASQKEVEALKRKNDKDDPPSKPAFGSEMAAAKPGDGRKGGEVESGALAEQSSWKMPDVKVKVVAFFTSARDLIRPFLDRVYQAIKNTFLQGNVFDLFGNVIKEVTNFFAGDSDKDKGMFSKLIQFLKGLKEGRVGGAAKLIAYARRVYKWCKQPNTLRGLFTDPAGVLEGDAHNENRKIMRDNRFVSMARAGVGLLVVLRFAQLITRVARSSKVHEIVCSAASSLADYEGVGKMLTELLGNKVMSLVECPQGVKGANKGDLESKLAGEKRRAEDIKQKKEQEEKERLEKERLEKERLEKAKAPAPAKESAFGWTGRRGR